MKESYYSAAGQLEKYVAYAYDGEQLVSERTYTARGSLTSQKVYEYDLTGNPISVQYADGKGAVRETRKYE